MAVTEHPFDDTKVKELEAQVAELEEKLKKERAEKRKAKEEAKGKSE